MERYLSSPAEVQGVGGPKTLSKALTADALPVGPGVVGGAGEVVEELHDGGVGLAVVEPRGQRGALQHAGHGARREEIQGDALQEPVARTRCGVISMRAVYELVRDVPVAQR